VTRMPNFTADQSVNRNTGYAGTVKAPISRQAVITPQSDPTGCFIQKSWFGTRCTYVCWTPTGFEQMGNSWWC